MRKILFLVLCLLGGVKVSAETYYSDYSNFSDYSADKVEESDVVDVEVERRYFWNCEIAEGSYYRLGENPITRYNINVNLNKESEFSDWSREYPKGTYIIDVESRIVHDDNGESYTEYRYKERLYYHFSIKYKKTDDYYAFKDGCRRIMDEYQYFYRYRTRDKIEVSNSIVITSFDEKIDDSIKSTSNYEIEGSINKYENGEYELNIKTDYVTIPIIVKVNISDNVIAAYDNIFKEKDRLLENIKKELGLEKDRNDQLVSEFNSLNESNSKQITYLKDELEKSKKLVYFCREQSEKLETEKNNYFEAYSMKVKEIEGLNNLLYTSNNIIDGLNIKLDNVNNETLDLNKRLESCSIDVGAAKNQLIEAYNTILDLNNKLDSNTMIINNINSKLLEADGEISKLNNLVINGENIEEKYVDVSKMLEICNTANEKLQEKLDIKEKNNNKNMVLWIFVCCLFFLFLCAFKLLRKELSK